MRFLKAFFLGILGGAMVLTGAWLFVYGAQPWFFVYTVLVIGIPLTKGVWPKLVDWLLESRIQERLLEERVSAHSRGFKNGLVVGLEEVEFLAHALAVNEERLRGRKLRSNKNWPGLPLQNFAEN